MKGGRRKGSGRKRGITDGRVRVTVRVKKEILDSLQPKPALKIRELLEQSITAS
jgi:hypothetical protein